MAEYDTIRICVALVIDAEYPVDASGMDDAASLNGELPNITINVI